MNYQTRALHEALEQAFDLYDRYISRLARFIAIDVDRDIVNRVRVADYIANMRLHIYEQHAETLGCFSNEDEILYERIGVIDNLWRCYCHWATRLGYEKHWSMLRKRATVRDMVASLQWIDDQGYSTNAEYVTMTILETWLHEQDTNENMSHKVAVHLRSAWEDVSHYYHGDPTSMRRIVNTDVLTWKLAKRLRHRNNQDDLTTDDIPF